MKKAIQDNEKSSTPSHNSMRISSAGGAMPATTRVKLPLPSSISEAEILDAWTAIRDIEALLEKVSHETGSTLIKRDAEDQHAEAGDAVASISKHRDVGSRNGNGVVPFGRVSR